MPAKTKIGFLGTTRFRLRPRCERCRRSSDGSRDRRGGEGRPGGIHDHVRGHRLKPGAVWRLSERAVVIRTSLLRARLLLLCGTPPVENELVYCTVISPPLGYGRYCPNSLRDRRTRLTHRHQLNTPVAYRAMNSTPPGMVPSPSDVVIKGSASGKFSSNAETRTRNGG